MQGDELREDSLSEFIVLPLTLLWCSAGKERRSVSALTHEVNWKASFRRISE